MQTKTMIYPMGHFTIEDIVKLDKKIRYEINKDKKLDYFLIGSEKLDVISNDKEFISMLAFVKFLNLMIKRYDPNVNGSIIEDYINNIIATINKTFVDGFVNLQLVKPDDILNNLEFSSKDNFYHEKVLLKYIINGYEKEYNVYLSNDKEKYRVAKEKSIYSMNLESDKVLDILNKPKVKVMRKAM